MLLDAIFNQYEWSINLEGTRCNTFRKFDVLMKYNCIIRVFQFSLICTFIFHGLNISFFLYGILRLKPMVFRDINVEMMGFRFSQTL